MTFPDTPRPGPPPGGFRPSPPPGGFRPTPTPQTYAGSPAPAAAPAGDGRIVEETGHPAVDEVLRSLANAARLAPAEQIAEYEAAHQVLQETLAGIDR
jgi:hypothetical protein